MQFANKVGIMKILIRLLFTIVILFKSVFASDNGIIYFSPLPMKSEKKTIEDEKGDIKKATTLIIRDLKKVEKKTYEATAKIIKHYKDIYFNRIEDNNIDELVLQDMETSLARLKDIGNLENLNKHDISVVKKITVYVNKEIDKLLAKRKSDELRLEKKILKKRVYKTKEGINND